MPNACVCEHVIGGIFIGSGSILDSLNQLPLLTRPPHNSATNLKKMTEDLVILLVTISRVF